MNTRPNLITEIKTGIFPLLAAPTDIDCAYQDDAVIPIKYGPEDSPCRILAVFPLSTNTGGYRGHSTNPKGFELEVIFGEDGTLSLKVTPKR